MAVVAALAVPAAALGECVGPPPGIAPAAAPAAAGLRFGMYPGGVAGQIGPAAAPVPDDPAKQLAALADLRPPDGPFVVHLYRSYLSDESDAKEERQAQRLVERYTSVGYLVEFVVRYRRDDDVDGYTRFLRGLVQRFGANPSVVALQIANEVNFTASPDSSDGAYAGARDALIQGVIAAKDEARLRGFSQLEIGFNWIYRLDPQSEQAFWGYLRDHGGPQFVGSLDWLGLDAYPGTFFPPVATASEQRTSMISAMDELRCYSTGAGIPSSVPIHVAENGYPTGTGRSVEAQRDALEAMVGAVAEYRATYNVTDLRWFDLRDADTASPNFQQHYGLMTDAYQPKPAYASWRRLVRELSVRGVGAAAPAAPAAPKPRLALRVRCYRRGVRAWVRGRDAGAVARVTFRARGTTIVDRSRPFRRSVRLRPERRAVTVRAQVRLRDRRAVVLKRRSPRCAGSRR